VVADLPTISIVTPSYNQGAFLEEAMTSVLGQLYPHVEYVVVDGGSTDGSVQLIEKYAERLSYWCSEPDGGHYDAINKGFSRTSGEIMAWLNSDDKYVSGAFSVVGQIFSAFPEVEWLSSVYPLGWNRFGEAVACADAGGFSRASFLRAATLPSPSWYSRRFIQQESTFWRRSLWERAGGRVDTSIALAADFELWARFYQHADLFGVAAILGGFRLHPDQKTWERQTEYVAEAESVLRRYGGAPYGQLEGTARTLLRRLTRGRSLRHSWSWTNRVLSQFPLANPTRTFVWAGTRWRAIPDFVI
jgi:glycosyltransferase involved in cell wall biosynthesis